MPCLQVELPHWGRLDRMCAWREFAEGVPQLLEQVIAFDAQAGGAGVCIVLQASGIEYFIAVAAAMKG